RRLVVAAVHLVGDGEVFVGVGVVKGDRAGVGGCRALRPAAAEKDQKRGDAGAVTSVTQRQWIPVRDFDRHVPTHVKMRQFAPRPQRAPRPTSSDLPRLRTATNTANALLIRDGLLTRG